MLRQTINSTQTDRCINVTVQLVLRSVIALRSDVLRASIFTCNHVLTMKLIKGKTFHEMIESDPKISIREKHNIAR
jgi:hypothetical protein